MNRAGPLTAIVRVMRKIFSFMGVSADGHHAGVNRDLAWQTTPLELADVRRFEGGDLLLTYRVAK